jgi:hypothetical protein
MRDVKHAVPSMVFISLGFGPRGPHAGERTLAGAAFLFLGHHSSAHASTVYRQVRYIRKALGKRGAVERALRRVPNLQWVGLSRLWGLYADYLTGLVQIGEALAAGVFRPDGRSVVLHHEATWQEFEAALRNGPVIVDTEGLGDVPGRRAVLVVGWEGSTNSYIIHDPAGNPLTGYKWGRGGEVKIPREWLQLHASRAASPNRIRYMAIASSERDS